jgi:hypothetical protein
VIKYITARAATLVAALAVLSLTSPFPKPAHFFGGLLLHLICYMGVSVERKAAE